MPPAKKPAKQTTKRPTNKRGTKTLSKTHLASLAAGRTESATVNRYLLAIDRPKTRGRKADTSPARLAELDRQIAASAGTAKLDLVQRKLDLQRLATQSIGPEVDVRALEREFVKVAKKYGDRKGISYGAWRALGVPAAVLAKAKVARTRS